MRVYRNRPVDPTGRIRFGRRSLPYIPAGPVHYYFVGPLVLVTGLGRALRAGNAKV